MPSNRYCVKLLRLSSRKRALFYHSKSLLNCRCVSMKVLMKYITELEKRIYQSIHHAARRNHEKDC